MRVNVKTLNPEGGSIYEPFPQIISWKEDTEIVLLTCDSSIFLSGLIPYQSEIENSEIDCQPKADHSAHDGVGNQVFSLEQAALAEYLLQCFKWHKGEFSSGQI